MAESFLSHTAPQSIHNKYHPPPSPSISNYHSPFKEREIDSRLLKMLWQKTSATNSAMKLSQHQYIPRYPFQTTLNNIFNRCFHFNQRHIQTTLTHLTHSKLPKHTAQLKTNSIHYPEQQSRPSPIPTGSLTQTTFQTLVFQNSCTPSTNPPQLSHPNPNPSHLSIPPPPLEPLAC